MDNLHPYDGVTRRFRDDDTDPARVARGRGLVESLLRLPELPAGLRYDFSFLSDGCGVFDRLFAAFPCAMDEAEAIARRAGFIASDGAWDASDRESLEWLVSLEDHPGGMAAAVAAFVAEQRTEFQRAPAADMRVWFTSNSDVNGWALLYAVDGELAYIAYEHG
jgi:hypothetical protein